MAICKYDQEDSDDYKDNIRRKMSTDSFNERLDK